MINADIAFWVEKGILNDGGKVLSRHFVEFAAGAVRHLTLKTGDRIEWDLQFKDGSSLQGGVMAPKGRSRGCQEVRMPPDFSLAHTALTRVGPPNDA